MTVSLIGKSLNGYSKFLLSKVTKKFWISHSFFFVSIFGRVYTDFFNRVKCAVTAVDSGRRALQFLGLDEEKTSSVGFDVRMNYIFKSVFISCIYEFLNFCLALFYFFRAWRWIWLSQITVCLEWLATNCLRKSRSEKFHIIHLIQFYLFIYIKRPCVILVWKCKQESSNFREIPVVIMSSENILTRIDRYRLGYMYFFPQFYFTVSEVFTSKNKNKNI